MQCKGLINNTQCSRDAVEGSHYCKYHGGSAVVLADKKLRLYELNQTDYLKKLSDRIDFFKSSEVLNLRDEIGILRVTLERLLNRCKTDEELLVRTGDIARLISQIESSVKTTHNLEKEMGELLSKEQAAQLAAKILSAIVDEFNNFSRKRESSRLTILGLLEKYNLSETDRQVLERELKYENILEPISDKLSEVISENV